jgi:predicted small metal-binding protein
MQKEIVCDCGWTARGTEGEIVVTAPHHGHDVHDLTPTREQVLARAKPIAEDEQ